MDSMNTLSLDADMMANLSECHVGDEKTLSVPVRVTAYGKTGAEFEVTEAPTIESVDEGEGEAYEESSASKEMAPAVSEMIAKRK